MKSYGFPRFPTPHLSVPGFPCLRSLTPFPERLRFLFLRFLSAVACFLLPALTFPLLSVAHIPAGQFRFHVSWPLFRHEPFTRIPGREG